MSYEPVGLFVAAKVVRSGEPLMSLVASVSLFTKPLKLADNAGFVAP